MINSCDDWYDKIVRKQILRLRFFIQGKSVNDSQKNVDDKVDEHFLP